MILYLLLSVGFEEINGKILCPREWVESMVIKDDSLRFITDSLIPWYDSVIITQDSLIKEMQSQINDLGIKTMLLEKQVKILKKQRREYFWKGCILGMAVGISLSSSLIAILGK